MLSERLSFIGPFHRSLGRKVQYLQLSQNYINFTKNSGSASQDVCERFYTCSMIKTK